MHLEKQRTDQIFDRTVECAAIGKRPRPSAISDLQPKQAKVSASITSLGQSSRASDQVTVLWFHDGKVQENTFYAEDKVCPTDTHCAAQQLASI